jgi:hypothetical protein
MPTQELAEKLPLATLDLAGYINIRLSKNLQTDTRVLNLYRIRRAKVHSALLWLIKNNPHYADLTIDFNALASLPEDGIPMTIVRELADEESQEQPVPMGQEFRTDIHESGLVEHVHVLTKQNVAEQMFQKFLHITSNTYLSDWMPDVFAKAFPWLFPNGQHAPSLQSKRKGMSFASHIRWLLNYRDRRFSHDHAFLFLALNAQQRAHVCSMAKFCFRNSISSNMNIIQVTGDEIRDAITQLKSKTPVTNPHVIALMKRLKIVTGHAKGSYSSRLAMRSKIQSMNYIYGCPAIFLTINPCDIHSQLAMTIAGQAFDPVTLNGFPVRSERERILASDPVACAKFCNLIFESTIQYLLGFFPKDHCFHKKNIGIFGKPLAYAGTIEEQGRKALHMHLLLWLDGFDLETVQLRLQSDSEFKERIIQYLNSTISEYCEGIFFHDPEEASRFASSSPKCSTPSHIDLDHGHSVYPKMRTCVEWNPHESEDRHDLDKEKYSTCSLTTFHPDAIGYENLNKYDVQTLVIDSQIHVHNKTCTKNKQSHCRMRFGKKIQPKTFLNDDGQIQLKRSHPYMNAYNETLLTLLRCNMDVKFVASASYAKTLNFYITNYITKMNMQFTTMYDLCSTAVDRINAKEKEGLDSDEQSKRLVLACFSKMKTAEEVGAPMAALLQLGLPDFHCSDEFALLDFSHFYYYQSPNFSNNAHDELLDDIELKDSTVVRVNQLTDYLYRNHSLHHLSVLEFYRNYYKVMLRGSEKISHLRFISGHPQSESHVIRIRKNAVIPQFIGKSIPSHKNKDEFAYSMLLLIYPYSITSPLSLVETTWEIWLQDYQKEIHCSQFHCQFVKNIILYQQGSDSDPPDSEKGDLLTRDFEDVTQVNSETVDSVIDTIDPMEHIDFEDYVTFFDLGHSEAPVSTCPYLAPITPVSSMWSVTKVPYVIKLQESTSIHPSVINVTENSFVENPLVIVRDMTNSVAQIQQFITQLGFQGRQRLVVSTFLLFCVTMNVTDNPSATNVVGVVLGEGGTGKSKVITAINSYFTINNQSNAIRLTSPTGVGAANILGMTIHSLLSLMSRNPNFNDLSEKLNGVNVLIIDEFAFLGLDTLHQIDSTLRKLWPTEHHRHTMPFGGYHILFIGDFMQLPPVRSYSIYTSLQSISKLKNSSKKTDYLNGLQSWAAINFVIVLRKNYRIFDILYQTILTAIRTETFTDAHYEYLKVIVF